MRDLLQSYLEENIKVNPPLNDFFYYDKFLNLKHIQPDIYSESFYNKLFKIDEKYYDILKDKKDKTFDEEILYHIVNHDIKMETEYEIYMYMPVNLLDNILTDYVTDSSGGGNYIFNTSSDYECFMKRLKSIPKITESIIEKMKDGIKKKITLYEKTVTYMINNINDILKNKSYLHKKKSSKTNQLNNHIDEYLVKSLEKFLFFLRDEYYIHSSKKLGLYQYKGGKSAYLDLIRYSTFKDITPEILMKVGEKEVKRLTNEKLKIQKKLKVCDINSYVKENKEFYYNDKKSILRDLKKIQKRVQTEVYSKYFHGQLKDKDMYDIKSTPVESNHAIAYYISSDLKNKKRGTFYINTSKPENVNKHELYVLSLHEGIPGHHYEINYHLKSNKHDLLKFHNFVGYTEGWGLYCEGLGEYDNDIERYFKIQYDIHRSLRLIIDTGIHYFGWDYDKCFQKMKDNLTFSDEQINKELLRYIDLPGQAITYKVGEKTISYLREILMKKGIHIQDFHEIIMRIGPCPLEIMLDKILNNVK